MAVTWKVDITVKNLARKDVSVRATRTDGEEVRGPYVITSILLDTSLTYSSGEPCTLASIRDEAVRVIRKQYADELAWEAGVEAVVSGYEDALKDALEAAEV